MCSARKASMRACSVRTFSEYSNSMAGSSLERPTIVSYDLFIALPIEGSPSIVSGSRVGRGLHRPKQEDATLARITLPSLGWAHELHVVDTEGGCQLVDADDRRVAPALLAAADVLLAESRALCQLLLREALILPDPLDVSPDQLAHVHAPEVSE